MLVRIRLGRKTEFHTEGGISYHQNREFLPQVPYEDSFRPVARVLSTTLS